MGVIYIGSEVRGGISWTLGSIFIQTIWATLVHSNFQLSWGPMGGTVQEIWGWVCLHRMPQLLQSSSEVQGCEVLWMKGRLFIILFFFIGSEWDVLDLPCWMNYILKRGRQYLVAKTTRGKLQNLQNYNVNKCKWEISWGTGLKLPLRKWMVVQWKECQCLLWSVIQKGFSWCILYKVSI